LGVYLKPAWLAQVSVWVLRDVILQEHEVVGSEVITFEKIKITLKNEKTINHLVSQRMLR
jgi:hypothetical protein